MQTHFNETSDQLQGFFVVLEATHECHVRYSLFLILVCDFINLIIAGPYHLMIAMKRLCREMIRRFMPETFGSCKKFKRRLL